MAALFQVGDNPAEYTFLPDTGGLGVALTAAMTASVPQKLPLGHSQSYIITNDGLACFWYAFCAGDGAATLAYLPVLPGTQLNGTFPNDSTLTHISVITRLGSTTGTINFGKGR